MKLTYTPYRTVSTADMNITCDPPILFQVKVRLSPEWARMYLAWEEKGADNSDVACKLIGEAFTSVIQGDETYPIEGEKDARELKQAIDESSPGEGDGFICHLLYGFASDHFRFLARNSASFERRSGQSNGTEREPSKRAKVKA